MTFKMVFNSDTTVEMSVKGAIRRHGLAVAAVETAASALTEVGFNNDLAERRYQKAISEEEIAIGMVAQCPIHSVQEAREKAEYLFGLMMADMIRIDRDDVAAALNSFATMNVRCCDKMC